MYQYLTKHCISISIILFLVIFFGLNHFKPAFIYKSNGAFRQFGINNSQKTIIPIWLISIILSILSYLTILWIIYLPRMKSVSDF